MPSWRRAYWIGIRRWPSITNTTETTIPSATSGKNSRADVPPLIQPLIPVGAYARIEAKIRIEIPLPMPRFVICSPIHMSSAVPPVSVRMMMMRRPVFDVRQRVAAT